MPGRDHVQCVQRWKKALDPNLTKGPWTALEDQLLIAVKSQSETDSWSSIAEQIPGRNAKQCRERWNTVLDSSLKKSAWTPEEDVVGYLIRFVEKK